MNAVASAGQARAAHWWSAPILLMETNSLLRRTVVLTARSLFEGEVHEASSIAMARGMLAGRAYCGVILALDSGAGTQPVYDLSLIEQVRDGETACATGMPIAVMVDRCNAELPEALRQRDVSRIILKPFRARDLLELVAEFSSLARRSAS